MSRTNEQIFADLVRVRGLTGALEYVQATAERKRATAWALLQELPAERREELFRRAFCVVTDLVGSAARGVSAIDPAGLVRTHFAGAPAEDLAQLIIDLETAWAANPPEGFGP